MNITVPQLNQLISDVVNRSCIHFLHLSVPLCCYKASNLQTNLMKHRPRHHLSFGPVHRSLRWPQKWKNVNPAFIKNAV